MKYFWKFNRQNITAGNVFKRAGVNFKIDKPAKSLMVYPVWGF
jgi:hypothetical protein